MAIKDIIERLLARSRELKDMLNDRDVVSAYCAPLPDVDRNKQRRENNGDYEPSGHHYKATGLDIARRDIVSYFAAPGTNTFHPKLTPGAIQLKHARMVEAEKLVTHINAIKTEFDADIAKYNDKEKKHAYIHDAYEMLMTKQVSRKIQYIPAARSLLSVSFSYSGTTDTKEVSYAEAEDLLKGDTVALERLEAFSRYPIRKRRQKTKRIYTTALIEVPGAIRNESKQLQGGIPLIGSNHADEPIRITPYKPNKRPQKAKIQAFHWELICPHKNLYAKIEK
ncbi:DNA replication terminus site-binding protein [Alteromonas antoniana]|uniref:DNA replication terminus site-binding protein n=1 Tax=Alteromonas antoniana TaxID=2803813 RepID=UPI001C45FC5E|nr:DNA replication terminus site-binding protein [Alteromonas antoniana]